MQLSRRIGCGTAALLIAGCGFDFSRTEQLVPGAIRGTAQRADRGSEAAPFAQVAVQGGSLVRRTRSDGAFVVSGLLPGPWLLRFSDDDDGDGFNDRTAFSAARIVLGPDGRASSTLLGGVGLDGTFGVGGDVRVQRSGAQVAPDEDGLLARVVLTRELCVPSSPATFTLECGAALADRISVGVEAEAGVDASGAFALEGIGSGTVFLYALLFAREVQEAGLGALIAVSPPQEIAGFAGDAANAGVIAVDPINDAVAPVSVSILLAPPPTGPMTILFSPPGAQPVCDDEVQRADVAVVRVEGGPLVAVTAPPGISDVTACAGELRGVLAAALIVPPVDAGSPPLLGPIRLSAQDPCGDPRDCDGDDRTGLPPLEEGGETYADDLATWTACAPSCGESFGADAGGAVCATPAGEFDCDDDGDGQPDVTEAQQCYGLGLGTDLDGDGFCSGSDPFPTCAANDAALCVAGVDETNPDVVGELRLDICRERPAFTLPVCELWTVQDADSDEQPEHFETFGLDATDNVVRGTNFDIVGGAVVYVYADHDIFLPTGQFAWTWNEVSSFPEAEIWHSFDAAGRTLDTTVAVDEDFDGVAERIERFVASPGRIDVLGDEAVAAFYVSQDADCTPETVLFTNYDAHGVPVAFAIDEDGDGAPDRESVATSDGGCAGGAPCVEHTSIVDLVEGQTSVTGVELDETGALVHVEVDRLGDGVFEASVDYAPGEVDRRAAFLGEPLRIASERDADGDGVRDRRTTFTYGLDGQLDARRTDVDIDGDGDMNDDLDDSFTIFLTELPGGYFSGFVFASPDSDLDGRRDFTETTSTTPFVRARPPLPIVTDVQGTDQDGTAFPDPWSQALGCELPATAVECTTDADCGADVCNTVAPKPAPIVDRFSQGFALTRFCGAAGGGAPFGAPCTGPAFNNPACASGFCDDPETGRCTQLCTQDADCALGQVCVVGDFGIAGFGRCAEPCAAQPDCNAVDARSCVVGLEQNGGLTRPVCDGDRGAVRPDAVGVQVGSAAECSTHLKHAAGAPHEFECTELCSVALDCSAPGSACIISPIDDPAGPVAGAFLVCVPP